MMCVYLAMQYVDCSFVMLFSWECLEVFSVELHQGASWKESLQQAESSVELHHYRSLYFHLQKQHKIKIKQKNSSLHVTDTLQFSLIFVPKFGCHGNSLCSLENSDSILEFADPENPTIHV